MQRSVILFAACAVLAAAPSANAWARPVPVNSVRVKVSDLDLTNHAGAETMLKRLRRASSQVCGGRPPASPLTFYTKPRFERCRTHTLARAVTTLDAPLVTFRHTAAEETRLASR